MAYKLLCTISHTTSSLCIKIVLEERGCRSKYMIIKDRLNSWVLQATSTSVILPSECNQNSYIPFRSLQRTWTWMVSLVGSFSLCKDVPKLSLLKNNTRSFIYIARTFLVKDLLSLLHLKTIQVSSVRSLLEQSSWQELKVKWRNITSI